MALDLSELMRRAKNYVENEAATNVIDIRFEEKFTLFGTEDVVLSVTTTDSRYPELWVVGDYSPMNLYTKKKLSTADEVFSFHRGLMLRLADRQFQESKVKPNKIGYDAFISHASEDKKHFVRPLAHLLDDMGLNIWYDEFELKVGDSLRQSIDKGLINSKYGIVILSKSFFKKNWPKYELDGLTSREMGGKKVILPIWYNISKEEITKFSLSLADKVALTNKTMTIEEIAKGLAEVLKN